MRANEIICEYVNKKIFQNGWKDSRTVLDGKYRLEAEVKEWAGKPRLFIHVYDDNAIDIWSDKPRTKEVGYAKFSPRGFIFKDLVADMVHVAAEYRRKGIASAMYKYAHELGNSVKPSTAQLGPGKEFWKGIKSKGGVEKLSTEDTNEDQL